MFATYLVVSLCIGLLFINLLVGHGFAKVCIKVGLTLYCIWTSFLLLGYIWTHVEHGMARLF